jgi:ribosome-associated heat shock protein Hsp15
LTGRAGFSACGWNETPTTASKQEMTGTDRADKWLWAVRLFKTRGIAAEMCAAGKVKRLGQPLKASSSLQAGDVIELPFPEGPGSRVVVVITVIQQRVSAPQARSCYEDRTPAEAIEDRRLWNEARRDAPRGRPTKRERRDIDRIRGFFE